MAMGIFDLLRDMEQNDAIEAISDRIDGIEARIERLEAVVRALVAKLDRLAGEGPRGS